MKTLNKVILIITVSLAGIILATSCSKETATNKKGKGGKKSVAVKTSAPASQDKNFLTAIRNGQYVDINWNINVPAGNIQQISILRNATGTVKNKRKIADLDPKATNHRDCLPDGNAYWYWISVTMVDKTSQLLGPVQVNMDSAGSANYINDGDKYKTSITRTDDFATLKWDFPEGDYKEIKIMRYPRPVSELTKELMRAKGKGKEKGEGVIVATTMSRKSQCTDALPDANSDYWYWFRITLKSGTVIDRGPIKAEYAGQ